MKSNTVSPFSQHSSHAWISDAHTLEQIVINELQSFLCKKQGCHQCIPCTQITKKNHPWIQWLTPATSSYSIDQIDNIIASVQFHLNSNEQRFFIFTDAHTLTPACSNRLLKTIEEPSPGYIFIFLTNQKNRLLPTLLSRCLVQSFISQQHSEKFADIIQPFLTFTFDQPTQFMKMIEKQQIKDEETKEIIDLLITQWSHRLLHPQTFKDQNKIKKCNNAIQLLSNAIEQLPKSGSSKLFWKNMYLDFHNKTV